MSAAVDRMCSQALSRVQLHVDNMAAIAHAIVEARFDQSYAAVDDRYRLVTQAWHFRDWGRPQRHEPQEYDMTTINDTQRVIVRL